MTFNSLIYHLLAKVNFIRLSSFDEAILRTHRNAYRRVFALKNNHFFSRPPLLKGKI